MDNRKLIILLVEDDPNHAELARRSLVNSESVYELVIKESAQDAFRWMESNTPDLLISDLRLPDGNGVDFISHNHGKDLYPVIIITSQGDEQHAVEAMRAGALDYVVKSSETFYELPHIIERTLREWNTIHQKQVMAENLREREILLDSILHTTADGFILFDTKGNILEANRAYAQLIGYSQEQLRDMNLTDIEALHDQNKIREILNEVRKTGSARFETIHRRSDNTRVDVEVSVAYLAHEEGKFVSFMRDVSQRKKMEEDIRKSEARYRTIFNMANEGIWALGKDGYTLLANQRMADMLGYTIEELIGKPSHHYMPKDQWEDHFEKVKQRRQGISGHYERPYFHKNGSIVWTYVSAVPLLGDSDEIIGSFAMFSDITERKKMEEELRKSEAKYRTIIDLANEGIWAIDTSLNTTFANQRMADMLGYTIPEIIGKQVHLFMLPDEWDDHFARMEQRQAGVSGHYERRLIRKDGSAIWTYVSAVPQHSENGEFTGSFAMFSDITERKQMEDELRQSEAKYRTIIDLANEGIWVFNQDFVTTFANQRMLDMIGYTDSEIAGIPLHHFMHKDEWKDHFEKIEQRRRGKSGHYERRFIRKDGSIIWAYVSAVPQHDEKGEFSGSFAMISDITDRKHAEEKLQESEQRLSLVFREVPTAIAILDAKQGKILYVNEGFTKTSGYRPDEAVDHTIKELKLVESTNFQKIVDGVRQDGYVRDLENHYLDKGGHEKIGLLSVSAVTFRGTPHILAVLTDITERKKEQEELQRSRDMLEEAEKLAQLGNYEIDTTINKVSWSKEVFEIFDVDPTGGVLKDQSMMSRIHPEDRNLVNVAFDTCVEKLIPMDIEYRIFKSNGEMRYVHNSARMKSDVNGDLTRMFGTVQDITERKQIEQALMDSQKQIQERLKQLMVLRDIDIAITSYTSMHKIVNTILERLVRLPELCAALLLISDAKDKPLKLAAQYGFQPAVTIKDIQSCESFNINQVINQTTPIFMNQYSPTTNRLKKSFPQVSITSCAILPMFVREEFRGVLILISPIKELFDPDWQEFSHSLAMQTAIALENASLFTEMQYQHLELEEAYEATIEGWSRTLEMRDKETKGHSERVTRLSLLLAVALGIRDDQLWDFRRGVLLHDIGKIAVPDSILFKPGPLNEEEWIIMRQHPDYGRQMLAGIPVLEKAIDIPYCHHEKWDGTGYPRGLKGEEIPLAARIFAIVDVWDALTSDRPYRPAWTEEMTRNYIKEHAGKHFDPMIVEKFFSILDSGKITL